MTFTLEHDYSFIKLLTNNLRQRYEKNRRTVDEAIHVSDIIPSSCLRRQYYGRKQPIGDVLTEETVYAFLRGESTEYAITQLANIGVKQCRIEENGIVARLDIMLKGDRSAITEILPSSFLIIELKDNASLGERLRPGDFTFNGYLDQLFYYLAITEIENGILCIKYSTPELRWYKRDDEGDHYIRSPDAQPAGIESWRVYLSMDDPLRTDLKLEMSERKDRFLSALRSNTVKMLPRLSGIAARIKCKHCPFTKQCWEVDYETPEAILFGSKSTVLDKIMLSVANDDT